MVDKYISYLEKELNAENFPRSIVLTSYEIACGYISNISVPAYTNDFRIVFCPSIDTWRNLYQKQLDSYGVEETSMNIIPHVLLKKWNKRKDYFYDN